jgi:hypothetical protein
MSLRGSMSWKLAASRTPGSGLNTSPWIHEKIAALTPMPIASDTTTTVASTGMRTIARVAWRTSRPK